jgi:hypothetical protein
MIRLRNLATATLFCFATSAALASPILLITHNTTDLESNAYIAGTIQSHYPSKPHNDNKVSWVSVKMACFGHTTDSKCPALIKMGTNTPNPVDIGMVYMDLNTGDINPKQITANGFTMIVNGPGETTLIKN